MFGACIIQIVNWAVTPQCKFPNVKILASKFDFKSAFQQLHLHAAMAVQTCMQLAEIGLFLMMLHLSFGGKPCPSEWGTISESICDLATAILHSNDWDPNKMYAPNQYLVPKKSLLTTTSFLGRERSWFWISPSTPAEHMPSTLTTSSA